METGNTVERGGKLHCMDQATTSVGGKSVSRAFVGVQNVHSWPSHTQQKLQKWLILEDVSADLSVVVML